MVLQHGLTFHVQITWGGLKTDLWKHWLLCCPLFARVGANKSEREVKIKAGNYIFDRSLFDALEIHQNQSNRAKNQQRGKAGVDKYLGKFDVKRHMVTGLNACDLDKIHRFSLF